MRLTEPAKPDVVKVAEISGQSLRAESRLFDALSQFKVGVDLCKSKSLCHLLASSPFASRASFSSEEENAGGVGFSFPDV